MFKSNARSLRRDRRRAALRVAAGFGLLLSIVACHSEPTTPPSTDALGKALDPLFERWNRDDSPGAAVVVLQGGKPLYRRAVGVSSLKTSEPITADGTLFDIASLAKHLTAYAALHLADRGQLTLEDEVRQHLPWFPDFGTPITLRQLIHHTAGLREYLDQASWQKGGAPDLSRADVLAWLARQRGLNFEPGEYHGYSNTGYVALAEVVAAAAGKQFDDFMAEEIFRPIGMERTVVRSETPPRGLAASYVPIDVKFFGSRLIPAPDSPLVHGDGNLFSTADELARWLEHVAEVTRHPGTFTAMLEPGKTRDGVPFDYAGGLRPQVLHGMKVYWHGGSNTGFQSWAGFVPEHDLTVVLLSNSYPGVRGLGPAVLEVLAAQLGVEAPETATPAATLAATPVPVEQIETWAGLFGEEAFQTQLTVKDGQLFYRSAGLAGQAQAFVGRIEVEGRGLGAEVDQEGILQALSFDYGAQPVVMRRYEPVASESIDWKALEGKYYSDELESTITVHAADGALKVDLPGRTDSYMPAQLDRFYIHQGRASSIEFSRDDGGQVDGLILHLIRSRNLEFKRVS